MQVKTKSTVLFILVFAVVILSGHIAHLITANTKGNIMNSMTVTTVNPADGKILTKQGEILIRKYIREKRFSIDTLNTDIDDWKEYIETLPHVIIANGEEKYILMTGRWEGIAWHFANNKIDKIRFAGFKINTFIDSDPDKVVELSDKLQCSFMCILNGKDMGFVIKLNGNEVAAQDEEAGMFSQGIPVNKFLKQGANTLEVITKSKIENSEFYLKLYDYNRQYDSVLKGEQEPNTSKSGTFPIPENVVFEKQLSIFDK